VLSCPNGNGIEGDGPADAGAMTESAYSKQDLALGAKVILASAARGSTVDARRFGGAAPNKVASGGDTGAQGSQVCD
jgi:hypothetical protein